MEKESYRFVMLDLSETKPKPVLEIKEYEIWIGLYHLGQGYDPPTEPQMLAKIEASSFKIACVLYEHQSAIDSLNSRMLRGDTYIEDIHFGKWCYDVKENSNSWTGKYFETKEEALETFKIK
jgi:hypothetical protein